MGITQRLGALSNTLSNIQVPIRSPPPRRLELNRRLPQSLRDFQGQGHTASGGIVIPVVHGSNGSIETGPITSLGGNIGNIPNLQNLIGTAVGNAIGGIQNNLNGLFDGTVGLGQEQGGQQGGQPSGVPSNGDNDDVQTSESGQNQGQNTREPSLTARVMTMISRPSDIDGNPIDPGIDRVEGINANITINANVSPNVTIRIIPESLQSSSNLPHSAHQNVSPSTPNSSNRTSDGNQANQNQPDFIESTPEEISRRVPALAPEIVSQIRDSVANLNDGRPVVIECENQNTNSEIGRVIGEAVTQTFQSLSDQITDQVINEPNRTETTTRQTTTTTTETRNNEIISQSHSSSRSENGVNLPQQSFSFGREELSGSFLDYLGAPENTGNPIIGMVRN